MYLDAPAWGLKTPGATALHLAAQGGHVKIMEKLLERGANIGARTKVLVAVS
jgi:ankyrin repeat protein